MPAFEKEGFVFDFWSKNFFTYTYFCDFKNI